MSNENMTPMSEAEILAAITELGLEVSRFSGNLSSFAYSIDQVDRFYAEGVRRRMFNLARGTFSLPAEELKRIAICLYWVCFGDDYATKEVAGRFLGASRRIRLVSAIERHPRAGRFYTLLETLRRGKTVTKAQYELAETLASEVRAA